MLSRVGKTNEQMGTNGIKGEVLKEVLKGTLPLNTDALIFGSPNYSLTLTRRSQAHPYLIEVKSSFAGKYVPYIFNHLYPYKCPCNCYINASMHVIPAQGRYDDVVLLDSRFHGNDGCWVHGNRGQSFPVQSMHSRHKYILYKTTFFDKLNALERR